MEEFKEKAVKELKEIQDGFAKLKKTYATALVYFQSKDEEIESTDLEEQIANAHRE